MKFAFFDAKNYDKPGFEAYGEIETIANGGLIQLKNYCNIAKELQKAAAERLDSVKFFQTSVAVIGSSEKQLMSDGTRDLAFITSDLELIASMNAFCAWVREAIKEKEKQIRIKIKILKNHLNKIKRKMVCILL